MEVEIKLNIGPGVHGGPAQFFQGLSRAELLDGIPLGTSHSSHLLDIYYDTDTQDLASIGAGLRLRVVDGQPHVTLKVNRRRVGALTHRVEIEEKLTQERLDWVLSHVGAQVGPGPFPVDQFRAARPCGPLMPVLKVETARLWRQVGQHGILVMDSVRYPGLSEMTYLDIEVESVGGMEHEELLRRVESALYQRGGEYVTPATESKLERGLRLANRRYE